MGILTSLSNQTKKYFKGLFAITLLWLLPALGIFILDSCKKASYDRSKSGEAAGKFNETLNETRAIFSAIILKSNNTLQSRATNTTSYYVDFPAGTNPGVITDFSSNVTIQSLTNVLTNYRVSLDDSINLTSEVVIHVPEEPIRTALQPLVIEAKNYLLSKGATSQQIADMLQEEGSEEIDLIPFVKVLTAIELNQYTVRNICLPFLSEAKALPKFLECGIAALGGDALYALSQSGASSWTSGAMKTAFKSVAKKFLGPIGVAVAIVSFGICMLS